MNIIDPSLIEKWTWEDVKLEYQKHLIRRGQKLSGVTRYLSCARRFMEWVAQRGISPTDIQKHDAPFTLIDEYKRYALERGVKSPTIYTDLSVVKGVFRLLRGEVDPIEEAEIEARRKRKQKEEEQQAMNEPGKKRSAANPEDGAGEGEHEPDEQDVDGTDPEDEGQGEAPEPTEQVQVKQVRGNTLNLRIGTQPTRQRKPPVNGGARDPLNRMFRAEDLAKVRVYKRSRDGKMSVINDYTAKEVGQNPYPFIKQWIDPVHKDPSGVTSYLVYKVDANNGDSGIPLEVNVESEPLQNPEDGLSQVERAVDLVKNLQENEAERSSKLNEVLDLAKQRVAQSQGGGMTDILMLGFMQKMFDKEPASQNTLEVALKLAHQLRGAAGAPLNPDGSLAPPPPPTAAASGPHPLEPVVGQLLEAHLKGRGPEKSVIDHLKDLAALKELFAPAQRSDPVVELLREELKAMRAELQKLTAGPPPGSFMGGLDQMKQFAEGIRSVAPLFNMGGLAGIIQGIVTSPIAKEVAAGIGASVKQAMSQMQMQSGQPATPATAPAPAPAPQLPPPRAPAPVPQEDLLQTPEPALLHMRTLAVAKEEQEQIASTCWALKAHFDDPQWNARLMPAAQAMLQGNLQVARQMVREFVGPIRPDLAHDIFVEKVVQTLLKVVSGGEAPKAPAVAPVAPPAPAPPLSPEAAQHQALEAQRAEAERLAQQREAEAPAPAPQPELPQAAMSEPLPEPVPAKA